MVQLNNCFGRNGRLLVLIKEQWSYKGINVSYTALSIDFGSNSRLSNDIVGILEGWPLLGDSKGEYYC